MPAKPQGDIIRELEKAVATLNERVDTVRRDLERIEKRLDESDRKGWMIWVALVTAILSLVGNIILHLFWPK